MDQPFLRDVRVLDLSSVGPATRAARWLADYGADVVKIEPMGITRTGAAAPTFHAYSAGRGLRRLRLDLKADDGREAFLALAADADVVLESFRPGVVSRLGVDYAAVRARNAGIVYCATTGYGQVGERSGWAGHDLNYLAVGGFLDQSGRGPDGAPAIPGTTVADTAAGGMHALASILAALLARQRTGEGAYLDVSVHSGVLALMSLQIDAFLATGQTGGPGEGILHGQYACYAAYRAGDGRWLTIAAIEHKFWANLCRLLGLEKWIDRQLDNDVQDEIRADIARVIADRQRDEWIDLLAGADTCVAPVLSIAELTADPDVVARGLIGYVHHPTHGEFRQLLPPLAGMTKPAGVSTLPGDDHTDCDELLAAIGYDTERINGMRERGIIG